MTNNKYFRYLSAIMIALVFSVGTLLAQSTLTGGITGRVTDPQSAIIPNATVKVTNLGTNAEVTVTATEDGGYRVTNLNPGTYRVEVSSGSFAPARAENVVVEVGRLSTVDVQLTVGTAVAEVNVTAEAPVLNTSDNSNTTNINQTSINELPINGRRASNFALLAPSTVPDGTFGLISFRGISGLLNNSTVDGGDNNQAFFSEERGRTRINYVISQASVREFQINGSNYSAEYGRAAGGVVNTVTKSGSNAFHGDLFYYNRNNRNGARNPLAFRNVIVNGVSTTVAAKPVDLRQQFGGAVGGPIFRDRLFFFFSYDQQKRNFPGLAVFTAPNFLNTANIACLTAPATQQSSICPSSSQNGKALSLAQVNNALNFLNSLAGETPRKGDQTIYLPKIDWNINANNTFAVSYNRMRWKSPNGVQTSPVVQRGRSSFGDDFVEVDSVNARLNSTISSNILNEARFQWGRDFETQFSTPPLPGEPLTSRTVAGGTRSPSVFISGGLEFGTPTFLERPSFPDERRVQFADTVTYTRGRHTFKFGADINRVVDDIQNLRFEAGSYSYTGTQAINDFIVDYVNFVTPISPTTTCFNSGTRFVGRCYVGSFQQGVGSPGLKLTTWDYNFFLQDDYRITPRLTVNLGVRYEYIKVPEATLANENTTGTLQASTVIPNDGRTVGEATSTLPKDKDNYGPRFGFAYDVFGDGKTSMRGGYGIYYGRIQNSTIYNALVNTGNPGGQSQVTFQPTTGTPPVTNTAAPIFPLVLPQSSLTFRAGAIQYFDRNFQAPRIHQYDFIFEHQIMRNTVISASYIGSSGKNLPTFFDLNFQRTGQTAFNVVGGPFDGQNFTLPLYGRVIGGPNGPALTRIQSTVESEYNALVFQANRRFTDGLQFQMSYTLSKSVDNNQNSATFTQTNSPYDIFDNSYDKGPSNFDRKHKFVASAVWAPTLYKGSKSSFYNYLLNGWSIAPIVTIYSGSPYSGTVNTSLNNTFGANFFPLAGRNSFRLPALRNIDLRLSKRFRLTESMNLEVLGEAFNLFNSTQVFSVSNSLYVRGTGPLINTLTPAVNPVGRVTFGDVTGTDSTLYRERQIQLAARFQF